MKIRFYILFSVLITLLSFSSCEKTEGKGDLEINFVAMYDDQPVVWNKELAYAMSQAIRYDKLNMFLSEIRLRKSDGEVIHLSDIELLEFMEKQVDESSAIFGITLKYPDLEAGAYSHIDMGIGVSPELNDQSPSDFNSSNPLSRPSFYWDSWDGYIFTMMEGSFAEDGTNFDKGFVFHTGTSKAVSGQSAYRPVTFEHGIEIKDGHTTKIDFILDAKQLFEQPGSTYIDIATKSGAHSLSDTLFMNSILGNFANALKVNTEQ